MLPAADRGFEAVAEIVFAAGRRGDILPVEVDATAGALFSNSRDEIHRILEWWLFAMKGLFFDCRKNLVNVSLSV